MGSRLGHAEAFPKRAKATQCLVPYSENKGYASNPRRFPRINHTGLTLVFKMHVYKANITLNFIYIVYLYYRVW